MKEEIHQYKTIVSELEDKILDQASIIDKLQDNLRLTEDECSIIKIKHSNSYIDHHEDIKKKNDIISQLNAHISSFKAKLELKNNRITQLENEMKHNLSE